MESESEDVGCSRSAKARRSGIERLLHSISRFFHVSPYILSYLAYEPTNHGGGFLSLFVCSGGESVGV